LRGASLTEGPPLSGELLGELLPIVGEVNSVLDPGALLPAIARHVRRLVDYRVLQIWLPEPDGAGLTAALVDGPERREGPRRIAVGEGAPGLVAVRRRPVFVRDGGAGLSQLAVPLLHRDRLVGVLDVAGPEASAFSPEAVTALQVLAGHLAIAIENATLYREARWYAGLLATLYEIGKETASILDLDLLLHRSAELVKRVIDYERFAILLLDEERRELVLRKAVQFGPLAEKVRIPVSHGLCGAAVRSKEAVRVADVLADPRYLALVPDTRSELVVPLIYQDRVIGVFDLESPVLDRFTDEDVKMLTPLASQMAVAVENARLYEEVHRRDARLARQMAVARQVQHGLFPEELPQTSRIDAAARFRPAHEIGGDLYDVYEIEEGVLGFAVGDVAGKGVGAALYGAFASGTVRARAFQRHVPGDLLGRVNRTLRRRGADGFFCALTYALFDFPAGKLRLAGSGLPYPVHFKASEGRAVQVSLPGIPLGMFDDTTYEEQVLALAPGDVFVFHTDGLTEATHAGDDYGVPRLLQQVEALAALGSEEIAERIVEDLDAFLEGGLPADDVTLVVVKVRE
jgi:sigma-B regulation protein RsbU (phosphoserine phosphatase)